MKRIAALVLLVALTVGVAMPALAKTTTVEDTRQSRSAAKKQEKMMKKEAKRERKAMKRAAKAQRKAQKASRHHAA
jgi:uncharacterized protein HemX